MQRLVQPFAPPIVQGQIQAATGRGAQGGQQGLQGLQGLGRQERKLGANRLQLRRNSIGVVMAVAGLEAAGFADAREPVVLKAHQQVLHRRRGAAADSQGHGLGELKALQAQAHGFSGLPWNEPSSWHGPKVACEQATGASTTQDHH